MSNNIKYFSVESRKGGVGKTTVSLELCRLLLEKGYNVLLFDLDFSGTRLPQSYLSAHRDTIFEVSRSGEPANLVRLYKELFLSGKPLPYFSESKLGSRYLNVSRHHCNYLASDIYCPGSSGELVMLEDPKVLNDSFHTYWMRRVIEDLSNSFAQAMGGGEHVAVVLDNAPGFSSMEDMVHGFLTSHGPDKGKFIMVSSLDTQDMEASRQGREILKKILEEKTKGAKYYHALAKGEEEVQSKSPFFDEIWTSLCASNGQVPEYYSNESISHVPSERFFRVIVNKVPRALLESGRVPLQPGEYGVPYLRHLQDIFIPGEIIDGDMPDTDSKLYELSGDWSRIIEDYVKYGSFLSYSRRLGMQSFFMEDWGPLGALENLRQFYVREDLPDLVLISTTEALSKIEGVGVVEESGYEEEIRYVATFLQVVTQHHVSVKNVLPSMTEEVLRLFRDSRDDVPLQFHTDNLDLQIYSELVTLFCLAVYRIHYYREICSLLNSLIRLCVLDVRSLEQLEKRSVKQYVGDVIEGICRINGESDRQWSEMVLAKINARELRDAITEILNSWEM